MAQNTNKVQNELALKRDKSVPIGLNDADSDLLTAIQNKVGETTFNLLSIPRPKSVTPESTNFIFTGKNLFNKDDSRNIKGKMMLGYNESVDGSTQDFAKSSISHPIFAEPNTQHIAFLDRQGFTSNAKAYCYKFDDTFLGGGLLPFF